MMIDWIVLYLAILRPGSDNKHGELLVKLLHFDGLIQKKHNFIVNALELRLLNIKLSILYNYA